MEYSQSGQSAHERLEELREAVEDIEDHPARSTLKARMAESSPWHPARLARFLFSGLTLVAVFATVASFGILVLPDSELVSTITNLEEDLPIPLPGLFGISALCMAIAWVTSLQASMIVARDLPRLRWEEETYRKAQKEIARIEQQHMAADRLRGTPMTGRPRIATPVPLGMRQSTGTPLGPPRRSMTPIGPPSRRTPLGPPSRRTPLGPPRRTGTPLPPRRATPLGPPGRARTPVGPPHRGTPIGASARSATESFSGYSPPAESGYSSAATPTSSLRGLGAAPQVGTPIGGVRAPYSAPSPPPEELGYQDLQPEDIADYTITEAPTPRYAQSGGFEQRHSTHFPQWGAVDEPWLEDAIEKAEVLASSYPVQAHLEFSPDANLPFALILERATPAMAVRAMVSYVDFLASIATPVRARIELRSVAHLDRSFHRNVLAALEPYFPDAVEVMQNGVYIEIGFAEPNQGWARHPFLPIEG